MNGQTSQNKLKNKVESVDVGEAEGQVGCEVNMIQTIWEVQIKWHMECHFKSHCEDSNQNSNYKEPMLLAVNENTKEFQLLWKSEN